MSLGTILVALDASPHAKQRCDFARALALQQDAHLVGLANARLAELPGDITSVVSMDVVNTLNERRRETARQWCAQFDEQTRAYGLRSFESRVSQGEAATALIEQARYADLVVVSQPDPDRLDASSCTEDELVRLVMTSGRPVLFVPYAGVFDKPIGRVLVTWSATPESLRAISDALPLLRTARHVDVLVINPQRHGDRHGQLPGADLSLFLARNGVEVTLHVDNAPIDVGNEILSRAADFGSELIVMGCFGHSRLRELLVGGVSLTILRSMTVPVLLSH